MRSRPLHVGHSVSASSVNFCTTSSWASHSVHAYWYVGTFFLAHRDNRKGGAWDRWSHALARELLALQVSEDTCALGSLPPVDRWSAHGGKAYAAAVAALSLEISAGVRAPWFKK